MKRILLYINTVIILLSQNQDYANYYNHAELYNEKSIEKSNSFTARGNTAITDYSGGLTYNYPLFFKKLSDRSNFNMSLVYNNNLSAVSLNKFAFSNIKKKIFKQAATVQTDAVMIGETGMSTISTPGWILNVNGVAVQLLNFNNRFSTFGFKNGSNPDGEYTSGLNVQRMFNGWQYQFKLEKISDGGSYASNRSKIEILNGDGGTDVFELPIGSNEFGHLWPIAGPSLSSKSMELIDVNRKGLIAKLYFLENDSLYSEENYDYLNRLLVLYPNGMKVDYKIDFYNYLNLEDIPEKLKSC